MTRTKPRRWIAAEIERLDPVTDYEAIWRLTSSYGLNDFALNLFYAPVPALLPATERLAAVVGRR